MATALSSQISGMTAFWYLPPLALNVILQPSGSVCGTSPTLRTYLRSSPFLCFVDSVSFLVRFTAAVWEGLPPARAAKFIVIDRNRGVDPEELAGLQALEKLPLVRWLAFLLGFLPQTLKILGCRGIGLTQAAACAYIGTFVLFEMVSLFAEGEEAADSEHEHLSSSCSLMSNSRHQRLLHNVDRILFYFGLWAQATFVIWALKDNFLFLIYSNPGRGFDLVWRSCLLTILLMLLLLLHGSVMGSICSFPVPVGFEAVKMSKSLICLPISSALVLRIVFARTPYWNEMVGFCLGIHATWIFLAYLALLVIWLSTWLCCFEFWKVNILFLKADDDIKREWERFFFASLTLQFTILTFGVTLAWYTTQFDGSKTSVASWTSWLG